MSASSTQATSIQQIYSSTTPENRYTQYEQCIHSLIVAHNIEALRSTIHFLLTTEYNDQYGRTYIVPDLLRTLIRELRDPDAQLKQPLAVEDLVGILQSLIELLRPKVEELADPLMDAIDLLAKCYEASEDYQQAALILSSYKPEDFRGKSSATAEQRFEWYLNIAEDWLEVGEVGPASQGVKRAQALLSEAKSVDAKNMLRFKTAYARILDGERKFIEASQRYYDLAQTSEQTSEDDRAQALNFAITCAILAKAGTARDALLAKLYADPRARNLENFNLLEKMYKRRIVRPEEVTKFESSLAEHQNATTATGKTVLQNSIIEHNILAVSTIYTAISTAELATILGVNQASVAESLCATMIESNRLQAYIDQPQQMIVFTNDKSAASANTVTSASAAAASKLAATDDSSASLLKRWDMQIAQICQSLDTAVQSILAKHPHYADTVRPVTAASTNQT